MSIEPDRDAILRRKFLLDSGAGFGWMAQDLHPSGAVGDATQARTVQLMPSLNVRESLQLPTHSPETDLT